LPTTTVVFTKSGVAGEKRHRRAVMNQVTAAVGIRQGVAAADDVTSDPDPKMIAATTAAAAKSTEKPNGKARRIKKVTRRTMMILVRVPLHAAEAAADGDDDASGANTKRRARSTPNCVAAPIWLSQLQILHVVKMQAIHPR
jgi:hypothetical protein